MKSKKPLVTILHCSFCGKSQHEVRKLIAGLRVFVCDECVCLCMDIVGEETKDVTAQKSPDIEKRAVICREVYLPPDYRTPFMTILTHFIGHIQTKYAAHLVGISLYLKDTKVELNVCIAKEFAMEMERNLSCYGLVLGGRLPPEEYFDSDEERDELIQRLRIAAQQLEEAMAAKAQRGKPVSQVSFTSVHPEQMFDKLTEIVAYFFGH